MLLKKIDADTENYFFVQDCKRGFFLLFTSAEEYKRNPFHPLWAREAADERTFKAMVRWAAIRRDRWQEWGELAERIGRDAFYDHLAGLMAAEPAELPTATLVHKSANPWEIELGQMLHGPHGRRAEYLHVHRFASAAARDGFFAWLYADDNISSAQILMDVAFGGGTDELDILLDKLAELGEPGIARPKRSKRMWQGQRRKRPVGA